MNWALLFNFTGLNPSNSNPFESGVKDSEAKPKNTMTTKIRASTIMAALATADIQTSATMTLQPPLGGRVLSMQLLRIRPKLVNQPRPNQRQLRKARRQAFAAGDRRAFNR